MSWWFRSTAMGLLGGLVLFGIAGCQGDDEGPTGGAAQNVSDSQQPGQGRSGGGQSAHEPERKEGGEISTPARQIDSKQLNDTVKAEVKGGESSEGPTPFAYLWAPAKPELIKDEPMTVKPPLGLQPLTVKISVPVSNPITKGKYELGRQLYFDPRVSLDGTVSCATCHNPARGWTDGMAVSIGIKGQTGGRHATVGYQHNLRQADVLGRTHPSLEGQAQGPIQNAIEMGRQDYEQIISRLAKIPGYNEQFEKVFGTRVTLDGMAKAIATFERVAALSGNSPYDKYNTGDNKALSESEKRGLVLFGLTLNGDDEYKPNVVRQKAKCTLCHQGFNFTDEGFHNLGVGYDEKTGKFADLGRWAIDPIGAKCDADIGSFKTPTLRDVARTAPYMHDGSLATLEKVMDHYDKGGTPNASLDPDMKPLKLTAQEKADVIAFMKALTGETKKLAELLPTLPPGPDGRSPDPQEALTPPAKVAAVIHPVLVK